MIIEKILSAISKREAEVHHSMGEATPSSWESALEKLNTHSLFGGKQVIALDGIDKLKKGNLTEIAHYVAAPSPFAYLILGAASGKTLTEIYAKGKKELVVCDLTEEKPWDRKERLKRFLVQLGAASGKVIQSDALEFLLDGLGLNLPALEQELFKLITYAGERKQIGLQDVETLCNVQKSSTLWQMAEAVVWRGKSHAEAPDFDLSLLLPLIGQIRSQIQQGLALALLQEQGFGSSEISHYLPNLRGNQLERLLPLAKAKRSPFFKRGLKVLFEIEILAKNSSVEPGLLLDLFTAKLHAS